MFHERVTDVSHSLAYSFWFTITLQFFFHLRVAGKMIHTLIMIIIIMIIIITLIIIVKIIMMMILMMITVLYSQNDISKKKHFKSVKKVS